MRTRRGALTLSLQRQTGSRRTDLHQPQSRGERDGERGRGSEREGESGRERGMSSGGGGCRERGRGRERKRGWARETGEQALEREGRLAKLQYLSKGVQDSGTVRREERGLGERGRKKERHLKKNSWI